MDKTNTPEVEAVSDEHICQLRWDRDRENQPLDCHCVAVSIVTIRGTNFYACHRHTAEASMKSGSSVEHIEKLRATKPMAQKLDYEKIARVASDECENTISPHEVQVILNLAHPDLHKPFKWEETKPTPPSGSVQDTEADVVDAEPHGYVTPSPKVVQYYTLTPIDPPTTKDNTEEE